MALIRPATLRRIQTKFGPKSDEGQVFIQTNGRLRDGAGWKENKITVGPLPARISFDQENRVREQPIAGQPGAQHRYLVELSAYTDINEKQDILWAAAPWLASRVVATGQRFMPTIPNGFIYEAEIGGSTSAVQPTWPIVVGGTVMDGAVTWECVGGYQVLRIVEIGRFDSYEMTRDVYCDLRT